MIKIMNGCVKKTTFKKTDDGWELQETEMTTLRDTPPSVWREFGDLAKLLERLLKEEEEEEKEQEKAIAKIVNPLSKGA